MKLRVLPRGTAMVPHFEIASAHGSPKRFVGHEFTASGIDNVDGEWAQHSRVTEVPSIPETDPLFREVMGEYRICVREGSLWAADAETAKYCGVEFDPQFGGEHKATATASSPRSGFVSMKGAE